jgi:hypothetical protein
MQKNVVKAAEKPVPGRKQSISGDAGASKKSDVHNTADRKNSVSTERRNSFSTERRGSVFTERRNSTVGSNLTEAKEKRPAGDQWSSLSPRAESMAFSKKMIQDMHASVPECKSTGPAVSIHKGVLKIQANAVECEVVQYACGSIDVNGDKVQIAPVFLHAMRMAL